MPRMTLEKALAALAAESVTSLEVSGQRLADEGARRLAQAMTLNVCLRALELCNFIGGLSEALMANNCLTSL